MLLSLALSIYSFTTKFIEGKKCNTINLFIEVLKKFKLTPPTSNANFSTYIQRIKKHLNNNSTIVNKDKLLNLLSINKNRR